MGHYRKLWAGVKIFLQGLRQFNPALSVLYICGHTVCIDFLIDNSFNTGIYLYYIIYYVVTIL